MFNKKYVLLLFIVVMLLITGCGKSRNRIKSGEAFTLFVATDIHYLAKDLQDDGQAFQMYYQSGDGKQLNFMVEVVEAFANDIKKKSPDILIISGDLTSNGEKQSHLDLAEKLKDIEKNSNTRVFVIPGNHDINNPWAIGFEGEKRYEVESISPTDFKRIYKNFGYGEAILRDKTTLSYLAAPTDDVWLLMLDTNHYKNNAVYGYPSTGGKISEETIQWIKECSELAKKNKARIVTVMHHNLIDHSDLLNSGFTLDNNLEVIDIFQEHDLNLTLSGHVHIQDIKSVGEGTNTLYDIVTSSLSVNPTQYGVLTYLPLEGFDYRVSSVDVEGWAKEIGIEDHNLLNFKAYTKQFFYSTSYKKTHKVLHALGTYSEEEIEEMSDTISQLNVHYFAGTTDAIRNKIISSSGYRLWLGTNEPEFLKAYVLSMASETNINNTALKIPNEIK